MEMNKQNKGVFHVATVKSTWVSWFSIHLSINYLHPLLSERPGTPWTGYQSTTAHVYQILKFWRRKELERPLCHSCYAEQWVYVYTHMHTHTHSTMYIPNGLHQQPRGARSSRIKQHTPPCWTVGGYTGDCETQASLSGGFAEHSTDQ